VQAVRLFTAFLFTEDLVYRRRFRRSKEGESMLLWISDPGRLSEMDSRHSRGRGTVISGEQTRWFEATAMLLYEPQFR
jgi:hypothetical protein